MYFLEVVAVVCFFGGSGGDEERHEYVSSIEPGVGQQDFSCFSRMPIGDGDAFVLRSHVNAIFGEDGSDEAVQVFLIF